MHLTFGEHFNQPIGEYDDISTYYRSYLPNSITHLYFGRDFNYLIEGSIPPTVTHLTLSKYWDRPYQKLIPSTVTHLTIRTAYMNNGNYNYIPSTITYLNIPIYMDDPPKFMIPTSVTHLIFCGGLRNSVKDIIPPSVTHLEMTRHFNFSIDKLDDLPLSIIKLTLGGYHSDKEMNRIRKRLSLRNIDIKFPNKISDLIKK